MKLYDFAPAPNPRRVRIFLAEKGIALPMVQVNLRANEQFSPAFRAVNADCTVPVLELDDGTRIADVLAICVYFETAQPEPPLMGVGAQDRADVAAWQRRVERDGFLAVVEAFRNSTPGFKGRALPGADDYEQIPALAERGRARLGRFFAMMDASLAGDYAAVLTQFHVDYYSTDQPWAEGTLDYASAHGVPIWNADQWLDFVETRHDANFTDLAWNNIAGTLSFNLAATTTVGISLTTMLPLSYGGRNLQTVTLDRNPASFSSQTIKGVAAAGAVVPTYPDGVMTLVHGSAAVPDASSMGDDRIVFAFLGADGRFMLSEPISLKVGRLNWTPDWPRQPRDQWRRGRFTTSDAQS
jgi:glutathione S-transferase